MSIVERFEVQLSSGSDGRFRPAFKVSSLEEARQEYKENLTKPDGRRKVRIVKITEEIVEILE